MATKKKNVLAKKTARAALQAKAKAKPPKTLPAKTKPAKPARAPAPRPTMKFPRRPVPSVPPPGQTVDDYVAKVIPWQRGVIERLRAVVKAVAPHVNESIRWGQPVYEHKGPFSYIKAHATHVNFGFWRGAELDDPKRMLQGEGELMRHVKILETHAVDEIVIAALVKQAVALNDKKGDPTQGR
jgi:hypothetical protein